MRFEDDRRVGKARMVYRSKVSLEWRCVGRKGFIGVGYEADDFQCTEFLDGKWRRLSSAGRFGSWRCGKDM